MTPYLLVVTSYDHLGSAILDFTIFFKNHGNEYKIQT